MKKRLFTLLMLLAATATLLTAAAYDFESGGVYYKVISKQDRKCKVVYGNDWYVGEYSGDVTIPATVTARDILFDVVAIGDSAFRGCKVTSVNIGPSVKSIGKQSFENCSDLTAVTLPSSLTEIGEYAFASCTSLTDITLPENLEEIGEYAFASCTSLSEITLPESLEEIGDFAFTSSGLTKITLPEGLKTIGVGILSECSSLTDVTLPTDMTVLPGGIFRDCTALKEISLPAGLTELAGANFINCTELKEISLPHNIAKIGPSCFSGSGIISVTVPDNVIYIEEETFKDCDSLTSVNLPEGLLEIRESAFNRCRSLKSIDLPHGISMIGEDAFWDNRLIEVNIPGTVKKLSIGTFSDSQTLHSVVIGYGLEELYCCFQSCTALTSVTLPNSLKHLSGDMMFGGAFSMCSSLTSITLPDSLQSIGPHTFSSTFLKEVISKNPTPPDFVEDNVYPLADQEYFSDNTYQNATLKIPAGSKELYMNSGWRNFKHIVEVDFSGINDIVVDEPETADGPVSVYNLQGVKVYSGNEEDVSSLPAGLYIIRHTDGTSQKRLVR